MPGEPAADDVPTLPHTWRPRLGPVVAIVRGVVLVVAALGMWFGLPAESRADFSGIQTVTLALVLLAILVGLYRLAAMKLRADEKGLTVVNLVRTRRLEWAEVLNVSLRSGDPWVQLDVDDGTTVSVMAIQTADGPRARRAATQLALLVAAYTRTQRND
jgi:PH (Pleckstrin Homology) domain-containing protein